jgi:hypothetical protein
VAVDVTLDESVLRCFPFEPVDVLGSVLHHGSDSFGHGVLLHVPEMKVAVDAHMKFRSPAPFGDDVNIGGVTSHRFDQCALRSD